MVKITEMFHQYAEELKKLQGEISSLRSDIIQLRIETAIITQFWVDKHGVNKEETYQKLLKEHLAKQDKIKEEIDKFKKDKAERNVEK